MFWSRCPEVKFMTDRSCFQGQDGRDGFGPEGPKGVKVRRRVLLQSQTLMFLLCSEGSVLVPVMQGDPGFPGFPGLQVRWTFSKEPKRFCSTDQECSERSADVGRLHSEVMSEPS